MGPFQDKLVAQIKAMTLPKDREALLTFVSQLKEDGRATVRKYAQTIEKKIEHDDREKVRIQEMQSMERKLREQGFSLIAGIDEVGRGPLAGPVVTCAVILPDDSSILYVDDSKKLNHGKRERIAEKIKQEAISYAFGMISPEHIDEMNILNATKHAMVSAAARLTPQPDLLLIDAVELNTEIPVKAVVHGDAKCYSIAAASILAKEFRDDYMREQAKLYPQYGFDKNMGYGTKEHIEAIEKYGLTPIHRKSFCKNFVRL